MAALYSLPRLIHLCRSPRMALRGLPVSAGHQADSTVLEPREEETIRFLEREA